ncbi:branched-chain amino acid ABC transporter substrate-binding protein, partial [Herbaspirillum frisingense]
MDAVAAQMMRQIDQLGVAAKIMGGDGNCTTELPNQAGPGLKDSEVDCAEAGGETEDGKKALDDLKAAYKKKFNQEDV